jgi:type I restriction enzyme S subunit
LQPWDIVVSTSGTLGRSAIVHAEHLPLVLNTSVIRFRPVEGKTSFSYLYQYLNGDEFLEKLEAMASGSVQKNFGPIHLKQIDFLLPSFGVMQTYEEICRPIYEKIVNFRLQSRSLAQLRDTLLPKLLSGELRVPDVEALLEQAKSQTEHFPKSSVI